MFQAICFISFQKASIRFLENYLSSNISNKKIIFKDNYWIRVMNMHAFVILFIFYILKFFIENSFHPKNCIWIVLYGLASVSSQVEVISSCWVHKTSLLYIILPTLNCCELRIRLTSLSYHEGRFLPCFLSLSLPNTVHSWQRLNTAI